ncbi:hypothetical protein VOLCADRAFT_77655 [Volvox carteri f. nagariensis]|uniref:Acyltransferase n=1 Tax=Volvox carteri f. nagariensis TaxID=3068 RepID=D8UGA9_VOLCA|nr:uncharacterized protein VOLCADRAFT_77655 [Volvox carteri f. nagariensis]EFJ41256.1 hypothetical protein VOLCADRAFT_77655 [Volvox carteri f. nagariensis]|eukprot:XP_002957707.1 hypothetical protein VOLCADRAFT_77655 [Volvox carteri f. nagariensis]
MPVQAMLYKLCDAVLEFIAVGIYVSAIYATALLLPAILTAFAVLGPSNTVPWVATALLAFCTFTPLHLVTGTLSERFVQFSVRRASAYFPARIICEDAEAFRSDTGYLFGFCPHSALPVALPTVFSTNSPLLPKALRGRTHGLASSVCFQVPIVRQLYWWLGVRPATRAVMRKLLSERRVAVVVPGGVQEVLRMQHGKEVAYLSSRTGFIRIAVQCGAPIVPVWAFGQTRAYSWIRPGPPLVSSWLVSRISRTFGAVPIFMYGAYGSSMPHRERITVVVGRPIPVQQMDAPPPEVVSELLRKFMNELQALYDKHKGQYGRGEELQIF